VVNEPTPAGTTSNDMKSSSSGIPSAAMGAVYGLAAATALLLGFLLFSQIKKRNTAQKSSSATSRGPLDITDTAFDNDDDVESGKRQATINESVLTSDTELFKNKAQSTGIDDSAHSERFVDSARAYLFANDDTAVNIDTDVLEDDELSSGSSTLFDVTGRNDDDAESSVFYESQGEEEDEDGTEVELDGTWGPDETTVISTDMQKEDEDDEESVQGSTISSLGASRDSFGPNQSPRQFMEWIKKSPLIPAAAKASVVAAAAAEADVLRKMSPPPSPVTLPANPSSSRSSGDGSGRRSW
jgi:hypothetical protein